MKVYLLTPRSLPGFRSKVHCNLDKKHVTALKNINVFFLLACNEIFEIMIKDPTSISE